MMRRRRPALVVLALCADLTVAAAAASGSIQAQPAQVAQAIQEELSKDRDLGRIQVSVDGTEATLSGPVPTLYAKRNAIRRALRVTGVETVASELELPQVDSDLSLAQQVARVVERYSYYTIWDYLDGVINRGVVTLTGSVTADRDKAKDIEEEVSRVRGVQEINNQIVTLPPSSGDNDLRQIIAYGLFTNELFERFASHTNPPFHIVVHNSVVTLVGVVQSDIEYREMERIVRQTDGVLRVHNKLETVMKR